MRLFLQVETKPKFVKKVLKIAQEAVERSKEIIDRLMGYTRSPLGKVERLDLVSIIQRHYRVYRTTVA